MSASSPDHGVFSSLGRACRSWSFRAVIATWTFLVAGSMVRAPFPLFSWDSFGYHLYLPAIFIHDDPFVQDPSWAERARTTYDASGTLYQISTLTDGKQVIKYPMGLALLWVPFFALGHVIAWALDQPMDGYGPAYQWSVLVGMLALLLIGLLALRSTLVNVFSDRVVAAVVLLLGFGTNLLDQATAGQAMPHLPLFCLYALMLRAIIRWKGSGSWSAVAGFGALAALAMLIRPSEVVCLLLPFFWRAVPGPQQAGPSTRKRIAQWVLVLGLLATIGSLQFIYWHEATGSWLLDTYNNPGEGFDLLSPHTLPFLFGFRKGWYIYTPLMLLATIGLAPLRRHWRAAFLPVLVFFLANLYLVSSWTCWWYAGSFSSRAMVGSYAVMSLPLAALISHIASRNGAWRAALAVVLAVIVGLNLFQHWQYDRGIIDSSRMTFAAWRATLLKTGRPEGLDSLLLVRRSTTADDGRPDPDRYAVRILPPRFTAPPASAGDTMITDSLTGANRRVFRIDREHPFTPATRIPFRTLTSSDHAWIEATWRLPPSSRPIRGTFVAHFEHKGKTYSYRTPRPAISDTTVDGWTTFHAFYLTPEVRDTDDPLVTYFWSQDTVPFLIEGPYISILEPIDQP